MNGIYALGFAAAAVLTVQDIRHQKINVLLAGIVWGIAAGVRLWNKEPIYDVAACSAAGILLIGLSFAAGGIGRGDGFAVGMAMSCLGFSRGIQVVALSFTGLCLAALILMTVKKAGRKTALPYVPWLFAAYAAGGVWL